MSFALRSLKSSSALRVSPRLTVNARQFHCSPSRAEQFLNANAEVHIIPCWNQTVTKSDYFVTRFDGLDIRKGRLEYYG